MEAKYDVSRKGRVSFRLGRYDKDKPLVIDPVLAYSRFLGGSDLDYAYDVAVDSSGNTYVVGPTYSPDFPGAVTPIPARSASFVSKLDPSGAVLWTFFLGDVSGFGANRNYLYTLTLDSSGNIYVGGVAPAPSGTESAFVAKLDSTVAILWTQRQDPVRQAKQPRQHAVMCDPAGRRPRPPEVGQAVFEQRPMAALAVVLITHGRKPATILLADGPV